jgi:hypothetical protein
MIADGEGLTTRRRGGRGLVVVVRYRDEVDRDRVIRDVEEEVGDMTTAMKKEDIRQLTLMRHAGSGNGEWRVVTGVVLLRRQWGEMGREI